MREELGRERVSPSSAKREGARPAAREAWRSNAGISTAREVPHSKRVSSSLRITAMTAQQLRAEIDGHEPTPRELASHVQMTPRAQELSSGARRQMLEAEASAGHSLSSGCDLSNGHEPRNGRSHAQSSSSNRSHGSGSSSTRGHGSGSGSVVLGGVLPPRSPQSPRTDKAGEALIQAQLEESRRESRWQRAKAESVARTAEAASQEQAASLASQRNAFEREKAREVRLETTSEAAQPACSPLWPAHLPTHRPRARLPFLAALDAPGLSRGGSRAAAGQAGGRAGFV